MLSVVLLAAAVQPAPTPVWWWLFIAGLAVVLLSAIFAALRAQDKEMRRHIPGGHIYHQE